MKSVDISDLVKMLVNNDMNWKDLTNTNRLRYFSLPMYADIDKTKSCLRLRTWAAKLR